MLCVVRYKSLRRADHSSRGVVPIVMGLGVMANPRLREGLGSLGDVAP